MTVQQGIAGYSKDLGSYENDKGKWVDWVFHVRWGWLKEQSPITEVYKNGVLVFERNGYPNAMNDAKGVFPKLGIYKWAWKDLNNTSILTKRVIYYDDYFVK